MNQRFSSLIIVAVFVFIFATTANAENFFAYLSSAQEVPTNASTATGYAEVFLNEATLTITYKVVYNNLSSAQNAGHIHTGALGISGPVTIGFSTTPGGTSGMITGSSAITAPQIATLRAHGMYVNIHTVNNGGGEIRGQLGQKRPVDFDGDGRTDYSVLRFPNVAPPGVSPINWWNKNSTSGTVISGVWGNANTDFPCPGDFDGDGLDDYSFYRAGATQGTQSEFWVFASSTNTVMYFAWGIKGSTTGANPSDTALCRDFDGDGKTDVAVARRGATTGDPLVWYIRQSSNNTARIVNWGITGADSNSFYDAPVPGDYDGDGKFDIAIFRFGTAPDNNWIVLKSSDGGSIYQQWGNFTTDYILPGDYDGDGKYDFGVARTGATNASPMVWYVQYAAGGQRAQQTFGITSDLPAQGDYDGDGKTDIAIYRSGAATGNANSFWVFNSFTNTTLVTQWGIRPDFAVNTFDIR
ncbi:hypothetical protein BH10ACI1_BH10ACI1_08770 [soil metagenome]